MVPDPVSAALGDFGPWQARSLLLLALVKIPAGWHMLSILFLAPNPETFGGCYICARDDPANISLLEWIRTRHPLDQRYPLGFNPCYIYSNKNDSLSEPRGKLEKCNGFEFFVNQPTMVSQWNLVCDRSVLVNVVQFFYLLGITSGGVVALYSLKRFSPKMLIMVGTTLQVSAGIAGALQPVFEVHCFLKCLIGLGTCLKFTAANQIIVDISTGWRRIVFSVCFEFFWSFGVVSLGWLNGVAGSWSNLHLIISAPSIIFLLFACIMPDSPRWLIAHGKFERADKMLKFAAACNGRELPADFTTKKPLATPASTHQKLPWLRVTCLQLMWIGTIVNYYGALLNIKNVGGPSLPVRTTIAGVAEIIGAAIGILLLLKPKYKFGFLSLLLLIGGTSCTSSSAIPPDESGRTSGWLMLWLAIVGRISIACSLAVMSNGSAELLPAAKRPVVSMAMVTIARMVLMTAPFFNSLAFYGESITVTYYGGLTLIAASGAFCLFVSTEWKNLHVNFNEQRFSPRANSKEPRESSGSVVGTYFNPCYFDDDEGAKTSIAA